MESVDIETYVPIVAGKDGLHGRDGNDGQDGIDGKDGLNGTDGLNGKDGQIGRTGEQGPQGSRGERGFPGEIGPQGKKGLKGERGLKGLQGRRGKDGIDGKDFELSKLTPKDIQALKKKLIGKYVVDVGVKDNREKAVIEVKYSDKTTEKLNINKPATGGVMRVGGGVTNITQGGPGSLPEDSILYLASIAPSTATYTGDKITLLTYDAFQNITNHTKTLSYTGDELTSTQEVFDYDSQTWTVDITLTYSAGVWQSKSVTINKV